MRISKCSALPLPAICLLLLSPLQAAADSFHVTYISPGNVQEVYLNQTGQIAGDYLGGDSSIHDFLWSAGSLKTFNPQTPCVETGSPTGCDYTIRAFNNAGQILANENNASAVYSGRKWESVIGPGGSTNGVSGVALSDNGTVLANQSLGLNSDVVFRRQSGTDSVVTPPKGSTDFTALYTNNAGDIAGEYTRPSGNGMSNPVNVLLSAGRYVSVNYPGSQTIALNGLTSTGVVYGIALGATSHSDISYIYNRGTFSAISPPNADFGTAIEGSGANGELFGVFDTGAPTVEDSFIYSAGNYQVIRFPGAARTEITGINASGEIVGIYESGTYPYNLGFFIDEDGNYSSIDIALNAATAQLVSVNNAGQIAGLADGTGFLATPSGVSTPEPASFGLIAIAALVLIGAAVLKSRSLSSSHT